MSKIVYVVTNPELGWDCVVGVFTDKDYVDRKYGTKRDMYVIHTETLSENMSLDTSSEIEYLKKFGRSDVQYPIREYDYHKDYLIEDSFNYSIGDTIDETNNKEIVSLILDLFEVWAKKNNIKYDNLYLSTPAESDNEYDGNYACMCDGMSEEDIKMMNEDGCELFEDFLKSYTIYSHG